MMHPLLTAEEFAEVFAGEFETQLAGVQPSNRDWTERFRKTLAKMGQDRDCEVYPSQTEANGHREGEFLYDFVWLSPITEVDGTPRKKPGTGQAELVAECEWGWLRDIGYDFEKLILAKAPLKLLMYDLGRARDKDLLPELTRRLGRYRTYQQGESYLIAGCTWNAKTRAVTLRIRIWRCDHSGEQNGFQFLPIRPSDRTFRVD